MKHLGRANLARRLSLFLSSPQCCFDKPSKNTFPCIFLIDTAYGGVKAWEGCCVTKTLMVIPPMLLTAGVIVGCGSTGSVKTANTTTTNSSVTTTTVTTTNSASSPVQKSGSSANNPFLKADGVWLITSNKVLASIRTGWSQFATTETAWQQGSPTASPATPLINLETASKLAISDLSNPPSNTASADKKVTTALQTLANECQQIKVDIMAPHPGVPLNKSPAGKKIDSDMKHMQMTMGELIKYQLQIDVAMQKGN